MDTDIVALENEHFLIQQTSVSADIYHVFCDDMTKIPHTTFPFPANIQSESVRHSVPIRSMTVVVSFVRVFTYSPSGA